MTTAVQNKHLTIERNKRYEINSPELIVELNSSRQKPVSFPKMKNRLGSGECVVIKKPIMEEKLAEKNFIDKTEHEK